MGSRTVRVTGALYGVFCYVVFVVTFVYALGFIADWWWAKTIDRPQQLTGGAAVALDVLLLLGFAVSHSGMARPFFKKWWTTVVPQAVERSTYVLTSSVVLLVVFWAWQPIDAVVWDVRNGIGRMSIEGLYWAGWTLTLSATFAISHFDFFGLRQVYLYYRAIDYTDLPFKETGLYAVVRHPLALGFVIAFWAASTMTAGHLLFSGIMTLYLGIGTLLEERDLVQWFGDTYRDYRRRVPAIVPFFRQRR